MATTYEVVLYGASGYTGKLTAWKLAERGIPFIAAGRSKERLEEELAKVPELAGHDYQCVAVQHERGALTEFFKGKKVVINIVGPFMQLGRPVVEASLAAGCNYFDTTGETDWMSLLKRTYGESFAARGLALCPGNSYMWAEGNLAAEIALETPGIDTLDVLYLGDSEVSVASTMSFLRMCTQPQYYLRNKQLVQWPWATPYQVHVLGEHMLLNALPWSGGGEPVWYQDDPRVRNCQTLVSFRNQERFLAVVGLLKKFEEECRHLDPAKQEEVTNEWGKAVTQVEPPRENPDVNRCTLSCQGRGNTNSVSVILRGNSPYAQTGVLGAEAARRVLRGQLHAVGFVSPAQAFGARNLVAAQAEEGYLAYEVKSV
ncbi:saccharopine dehydrogenase family protein [Paraburkholderia aspalathi]|uniref:saccharopine dehydrogenase family protein n=1 Tax=Paraburkholderia aspalathi TaxID=1324617 RepID=UPI0038BC10C8